MNLIEFEEVEETRELVYDKYIDENEEVDVYLVQWVFGDSKGNDNDDQRRRGRLAAA